MGGTFFKDSPADSVIIYRGLEYWIEADLKKHECRIYKTCWINECTFVLIFNNRVCQDRSVKSADSIAIYPDSLFYTMDSCNLAGIRYQVKSKRTVSYQHLTPLPDKLAWQYIIDADTNLYFDTAEIKELYGKPIRKYYWNVPYFINMVSDSGEIQFIDYMISLFKNGDIRPALNVGSAFFHARSSDTLWNDYSRYVQNVFGKLKSFQTVEMQDGYNINNTFRAHTYVVNATFEKVKGSSFIHISTLPQADNPLLSLTISSDSAYKVPFFKELTGDFWKLLKQKKFHEIYTSSSSMLQSNISYKEAVKIFTTIDSLGYLDKYAPSFQSFTEYHGKGIMVISFKATPAGKVLAVDLYYTFENGEYKLAEVSPSKN